MTASALFEPRTIGGVRFKNRILRSSVGGRTANYDGSVTDVWKNFEKRFADAGVAGIISTTFHVNRDRVSPFEYPSIAHDRFIAYLAKGIRGIKKDAPDCRYIVQIGDPGYATYTSLFPQDEDAGSSSDGFDLAFGYNNSRRAMSEAHIDTAIANYAEGARRVREAGADGLEITATKGYLIHQFLNPAINRRQDRWGASADDRFRFLRTVVDEVRSRVGPDYLLGIRLSAADYTDSPPAISLFRRPSSGFGNDVPQMLQYAKQLEGKVDYLHVVSGYGFPNPRDTPGAFPLDEVRIFFNHTRHLSSKAAVRATLLNTLPTGLARWVMNLGWGYTQGINLEHARRFRREVDLPVVVNGGFQEMQAIADALQDCDMVSMARALIANPGLLADFQAGKNAPDNRCTFCNRCVGRTGTSPLGCYDPGRFASQDQMFEQIMEWNRPDPA